MHSAHLMACDSGAHVVDGNGGAWGEAPALFPTNVGRANLQGLHQCALAPVGRLSAAAFAPISRQGVRVHGLARCRT